MNICYVFFLQFLKKNNDREDYSATIHLRDKKQIILILKTLLKPLLTCLLLL